MQSNFGSYISNARIIWQSVQLIHLPTSRIFSQIGIAVQQKTPKKKVFAMKYTIALCLVLVAGCNAFYSTQDVDFQPFLTRQQNAMRFLISAQAANADPDLVNSCFGEYLNSQQIAMGTYNQCYTGCVNTAQSEKDELTSQSAAIRKDLLSRSDNMCGVLSSCDKYVDGLQFFDCYRNAVSTQKFTEILTKMTLSIY